MVIPAKIDLKGISSTVSLSVEEMFEYMSNSEKDKMLSLIKEDQPGRIEFGSPETYTESEFYDVLKSSWESRIHVDLSKVDKIKEFLRSLDLY